MGYLTINTYRHEGILRKDILDSMPAISETEHIRHVRFDKPLRVMLDGTKQKGAVLLPQDREEPICGLTTKRV